LAKSKAGLADYSWNVVEYLRYGLHGSDDLDDPDENPRSELLKKPFSRTHLIWERHSWDYVPLLRAATVLSKYPIFLLWFSRSTPVVTLNSLSNQGYMSMAKQDMDIVSFEMQLAGTTSTYFLQLYLEYLGKYALEIFAAVHIKPVHSYWWKHVSPLRIRSVDEPPMCSCSEEDPDDFQQHEFDDFEFDHFVNENDTLEVED
jgi:hypothetical protein